MADVWLIADTHFGYERVLSYTYPDGRHARPHRTPAEMTEFLIDRWNSVVKPDDIVWHLGDVTNVYGEPFEAIWNRLNGTKNLVVGNHDDIMYFSRGGFFERIVSEIKFRDHRLYMTHVPVHETQHETGAPGSGKLFCNVHGHIHQLPSPDGLYINVSVEAIDFTPVHLEEISCRAKNMLTMKPGMI